MSGLRVEREKLPAEDLGSGCAVSRPCARYPPGDTETGLACGDPEAAEEDPEGIWDDPGADPVRESA
jgi:hypothetical protein